MEQERRHEVRHLIELPIKYRVVEVQTAQTSKDQNKNFRRLCLSRTKDISAGGLLFSSAEQLLLGTLLELSVPIREKTFTVRAHVVHVHLDPASGLFRTGVQFSNPASIFKIKMAEQLYQIVEYRKKLSEAESRLISEAEAAKRWIEENSEAFAEFYK